MADKPEMKRLTVDIDTELHRQVRIKSAETGTPITEILRRALLFWVRGDPPPEEKRARK